MIIALYTSGGQYMPLDDLNLWLNTLKAYGIECYFNCDFALTVQQRTELDIKSYCSLDDLPSGVEMVISYGGDGTFLKCVNMFFELNVPVLGVNSGRLGFLANVSKKDIVQFVEYIVNGEYSIEERSLIYCQELDAWALNECTIQKKGLSMVELRISIDGEYVADYNADGIIVATATGSTAYSLSMGGAIIAPNCDCVIINPIAPHNLNLRSLIVAGSSTVTVQAHSRSNDIFISMDNREYECNNPITITLCKLSNKVKLVKFKDVSFYKTLREKLMWGVDSRIRR